MSIIWIREDIKKKLDKIRNGSYGNTIDKLITLKNIRDVDYELIREIIREELNKIRSG